MRIKFLVLGGGRVRGVVSFGCGALSAKCTAGPNQYPWVFFVSIGVALDPAETPFAKTPSSRFLTSAYLRRSACGAAGRCTGPKWSKVVPTTIWSEILNGFWTHMIHA